LTTLFLAAGNHSKSRCKANAIELHRRLDAPSVSRRMEVRMGGGFAARLGHMTRPHGARSDHGSPGLLESRDAAGTPVATAVVDPRDLAEAAK